MMIPMLVIFLVSMGITVHQSISEAQTTAHLTIINLSKNVESSLEDYIYQNDLLTRSTRISKMLNNILTGRVDEYSDLVTMSMLRATLLSIVDVSPYLNSVYMTLDDHEFFFTSTDGLQAISSYYDKDWQQDIAELTDKNDVLIKRRLLHNGTSFQKKEVISVYKQMLLLRGALIANIDADQFEAELTGEIQEAMDTFFVVSQAGEILASNAKGSGMGEAMLSYLANHPSPQDEISQWVRLDGELYLLDTAPPSDLGLQFCYLVPYRRIALSLTGSLLFFLFILLSNCGVIALLAYNTTNRVFKQINYMVDVFANADKGILPTALRQKVDDEYDIIMNNIIHLFLNTTHLNTLLAEKQHRKDLAELHSLQLQINPHFLYNTLQTIDFEARREDGDRFLISRMVQDLSSILKYSLSSPNSDVTLGEDLEHLKSYVRIQRVRFTDRFVLYYDIAPECMDARVFSLMLQPLVENSILHGIRGLKKRGFIRIRAYKDGERLCVSVLDNGSGMDEQQQALVRSRLCDESNTGSIGLANVHKRLILRYGEASGLHIRSYKDVGTRVFFSIPYQNTNIDTISKPLILHLPI